MPAGGVSRCWTDEDVRALGVTVDLVTAGSVLGLGRSASYELARRDEFPVPVLRVGHRYRVVTAHLRELLGVAPAAGDARPADTRSGPVAAGPPGLRPVSGL